jgi:sugar lactone lactonase YvrE
MCDENWVEPGWSKQLRRRPVVRSVAVISPTPTEGFDNKAEDCSLVGKMDRIVSADPGGRTDLMALFDDGYDGKKGVHAIKLYWNKCFGLPFTCNVADAPKTAQFNGPYGIAIDSNDNLYVSDMRNNAIRKITPRGIVSTFAKLDGAPAGIVVTQSGTVFTCDYGKNLIYRISPAGTVTTFAGNGDVIRKDGTGTAASFAKPSGLALGLDGTLYVADTANHAIRRISQTGVVETMAGGNKKGCEDGGKGTATLNLPAGIAVDAGGNVYVSELGNNYIRRITPGGEVSTVAGLEKGGIVGKSTQCGVGGGNAGGGTWKDGRGREAAFDAPLGLAMSAGGILYVADTYNQRIRKMTSDTVVTTLAGNSESGRKDGVGPDASFYRPSGLAVDSQGNIFVADQFNNTIRRITPGGVVTTFAGSGSAGLVDSY